MSSVQVSAVQLCQAWESDASAGVVQRSVGARQEPGSIAISPSAATSKIISHAGLRHEIVSSQVAPLVISMTCKPPGPMVGACRIIWPGMRVGAGTVPSRRASTAKRALADLSSTTFCFFLTGCLAVALELAGEKKSSKSPVALGGRTLSTALFWEASIDSSRVIKGELTGSTVWT